MHTQLQTDLLEKNLLGTAPFSHMLKLRETVFTENMFAISISIQAHLSSNLSLHLPQSLVRPHLGIPTDGGRIGKVLFLAYRSDLKTSSITSSLPWVSDQKEQRSNPPSKNEMKPKPKQFNWLWAKV